MKHYLVKLAIIIALDCSYIVIAGLIQLSKAYVGFSQFSCKMLGKVNCADKLYMV